MAKKEQNIAHQAVSRIGVPVQSFDVFETLLVRAVSPPAALFVEIGRLALKERLISIQPSTFGASREWAEKRVNASGKDRGTLDNIYAELAFSLRLSAEQQTKLRDLELATERRLLCSVPGARPLVDEARRRGGRVVFVSDMYLPVEFIRDRLREHGFWNDSDVLYVSHTHGCSKRTGELFRTVLENERLSSAKLVHSGNDRAADVIGARLAGCKGVLLPNGNPNRFEKTLSSHRVGTDNVSAMLAGASRLARLDVSPATARDKALVHVASGVIGPAWTCYLMWVFQRARELELKRLYFVARDAEVLMSMAEGLLKHTGQDISCRYLYGSRAVWNRTMDVTDSPEAWRSLVLQSAHGLSNRALFMRTGLSDDEAAPFMELGEDAAAWGSTTNRTVLEKALARLHNSNVLKMLIARNRADLHCYLRQEGLFDGVEHGFVDIGWKGTQHEALVAIQSEYGLRPARGLFFGLEDSACRFSETRESYFFDSRVTRQANGSPASNNLRRGAPRTRSQFTLLEVFCAGSHGTLIGYKRDKIGIAPVLADGRDEDVAKWGLGLVRQTLHAFVDRLLITNDFRFDQVDLRQALLDVSEAFRVTPTRHEAEAWGRFPWELGQGSNLRTVELAPARSLRGAMVNLARRVGLARNQRVFSEWAEGSRARSGMFANALSAPVESAKRLTLKAKRVVSKIK